MIAGGVSGSGSLSSAELFNPVTDTSTRLTGDGQSLGEAREGAVAATLPDGQVLIAGGVKVVPLLPFSETKKLASAELFDPATDTFSKLTGTGQSLSEARYGAVAATLPSGQVLVAGGYGATGAVLSSAELFDPATDTFTELNGAGQALAEARGWAVAATLPSGEVLIAGGVSKSHVLSSAELFNPATEVFTKLTGAGSSLSEAREGAVAATLPNGQVLIAGGYNGSPVPEGDLFSPAASSEELFNPATDTFSKLTGAGQSLSEARKGAVAATLASGEVLIAGGSSSSVYASGHALSNVELFNPATDVSSELTNVGQSLNEARDGALAAPLPNGQVLIAGGGANGSILSGAELFSPDSNNFTKLEGSGKSLVEGRAAAVAATLPNGQVLIAGGAGESRLLASAELFNPATETFAKLEGSGGSLSEAREAALAVPLPSGEVLIAGGSNGISAISSAELFNPATDTFSKLTGAGQSLSEARYGAVAARLPSGEVLIAGGEVSESSPRFVTVHYLATAELFDPVTHTFSKLSGAGQSLSEARGGAIAGALGDGEILIAGGVNNSGVLSSAELFNPTSDTFMKLTGAEESLIQARDGAVSAMLPSGQLLIASGYNESGGGELSSAELFVPAAQAQITGGAFAELPVGQHSPAWLLTVKNVGAQALSISGATIAGANASAFAIAADSCAGIALGFGEACTISLTFTPVSQGAASATLKLEDNESEPAVVALSGVGVGEPPGEETAPKKNQEESAGKQRQEEPSAAKPPAVEAPGKQRGEKPRKKTKKKKKKPKRKKRNRKQGAN